VNKIHWIFICLAILVISGCTEEIGKKPIEDKSMEDKNIERVGVWKDCDPTINNCEIGLKCEHYYDDVYRCIKYLEEGEECGISVAEKCSEGLKCTPTPQKRQRCGQWSLDGAMECSVENKMICLKEGYWEGTKNCKDYLTFEGKCVKQCPEGFVGRKLTEAREGGFCITDTKIDEFEPEAMQYCETDSDCQPLCGYIEGNIGYEPCMNKFYIEQNADKLQLEEYCEDTKGKRCGSCKCNMDQRLPYGFCERVPEYCPK